MISRGSRCPLYLATLLGLGLSALPSLASSEELYLSEEAFLADIPEITSATRLSQRLTESPASISIITRDMISASGALNVPDLLRLVPGFQSFHVSANKFATTYHGASDNFPRRLEVMVDGRSVYLPLLATVDWTSLGLNLQDIERIEVVRGSNVPTQGSNAFMGSINIITREPAAEQGGYVSATAGSMDTRNLQFGHSDSLGLWSYRLSGGHEQNDGTDLFSDSLTRNYLSVSGSYTPTLQETLWLQAGIDRGHTHVGQADKLVEQYHRRDHSANYQSIKYQNLYSNTGTLQLTAYHNYLDLETPVTDFATVSDFLSDGLGFEPPASLVHEFIALNRPREDAEHGTTHTYDAELQLTEQLDQLDLVSGLGYRRESAESDVLLQSGKVSEERWRLFSNLNWQLAPSWNLSTGFMYEDSSEGSDTLSYRHALVHKLNAQSSLRLGYSISERLPSLLERYNNNNIYAPASLSPDNKVFVYDYDKAANPNIGTEKITTYELGYYQAFRKSQGHLDLRLFREQQERMIGSYYVYADEVDSRTRVGLNSNNFSWENRGVELQLKRYFGDQFFTVVNYAYTNTLIDPWVTNKDLNGATIAFEDAVTPEHTASLMLNWQPTVDLNLSLMHYYMDSVDWFEGGVRDSYQRTDLRAAQRWAIGPGSELEAALTVQNAFGPTYAEFYEYNLFDRRVWLQLMLRYH
ncbi:TonB-dependent receptor [Marinobacterium maritimum]|uniref:TonB-dependent receptor n=1 Tax=Marinobacterium maritimum TaxID=500162 RepID=A0ABP3TAP9_9GAMM